MDGLYAHSTGWALYIFVDLRSDPLPLHTVLYSLSAGTIAGPFAFVPVDDQAALSMFCKNMEWRETNSKTNFGFNLRNPHECFSGDFSKVSEELWRILRKGSEVAITRTLLLNKF